MPDPDAQRTKTVSQNAIKDLQKRGMSENLKMYSSGQGGSEFRTAMERYYSPQRLKGASSQATKTTSSSAPKSESTPSKPVPMPASAPAAASRSIAPKGMAQSLGAPVPTKGPSKPKTNAFNVLTSGGSSKGTDLSTLFKPKNKGPSQVEKDYARLYPGK